MNRRKGLVLDANILIRAVLGPRVRTILNRHEITTPFYSPDACFEDAAQYLPTIFQQRHEDPSQANFALEQLRRLVVSVDSSLYGD